MLELAFQRSEFKTAPAMFSQFCSEVFDLRMNSANANTAKKIYGGDKILVSGDQNSNFIFFHPRILKHCRGNKRINAFFFCSKHTTATAWTNFYLIVTVGAYRTGHFLLALQKNDIGSRNLGKKCRCPVL